MKKIFVLMVVCFIFSGVHAQQVYTMGYDKVEINVLEKGFFSTYSLPDQPEQCGIYDKSSETFYTCDYRTYRYVDEDFIKEQSEYCCDKFDFDPKRYYGTLTLKGVIESVEWDSLVIYFTTDKARLRIETDEREIDALYDKFYKENYLGKIHLIMRLKTFDTPNENVLSYNKNTEVKPKPTRTFIRILRW